QLPRLENPPVTLRAFRDSDAAVVAAAGSDPEIPLITTVPVSGTADDIAAYIARQHRRLTAGTGYSFAIADARNDQAVGQIGLWTTEITTGRAATGYWVAPPFRRHGYARAALHALSEWALGFGEVKRLALFVEPCNEASWRVAEACGYQWEGLLRSWQRVGDQRADMYVYSRIAAA